MLAGFRSSQPPILLVQVSSSSASSSSARPKHLRSAGASSSIFGNVIPSDYFLTPAVTVLSTSSFLLGASSTPSLGRESPCWIFVSRAECRDGYRQCIDFQRKATPTKFGSVELSHLEVRPIILYSFHVTVKSLTTSCRYLQESGRPGTGPTTSAALTPLSRLCRSCGKASTRMESRR